MNNQQKLGQTSAVFLTIGSMLGAGIFVKTKSLNILAHQNSHAILILMVLGIMVVLSLLLCLSLIISKQSSNLGFLEWTKKYCSPRFNEVTVNFTRFIYQPLSLLLIGIYVVRLLAESISLDTPTIILCSLAFVIGFMLLNLYSFALATKIQMGLLVVVLLTLFVLPLIGFYDLWHGKVQSSTAASVEKPTSLDGLGPWMILISGFPPIFFMYDGFYNALSLRDRLKQPKSLNKCLVYAFLGITVLYCYIIFSFKAASVTGSYADIPTVKNNVALQQLLNICVACSALLTLNATCMSNVRMLFAAHCEYRFKDVEFIKEKFWLNKYIPDHKFCNELAIWLYLIFKTLVWYVVLGMGAAIVNLHYDEGQVLFEVNDAIADVTSTIIFLIIVAVIFNLRKVIEKQFSLEKQKIYRFASYCSVLVIVTSCVYVYLNYLLGSFGFNDAKPFLSVFKLFITLLFILISAFPYFKKPFNNRRNSHFYQSLSINNKGLRNTIIKIS